MAMERAEKSQKSSTRSNHPQTQRDQSCCDEHPLLQLQQSIGNRALQRLIKSPYIQTKLQVSSPEDPFEQEADRVADTVMRMPESKASAPEAQPLEEEREERVAAKPIIHRMASVAHGFQAGVDVESRINNSRGSGRPLPDSVRSYMEPRFGIDFSHVNIHTDSDATELNRDLGARAFTYGSDIYFGAGHSPANLALTAHELSHVIQQTGSTPLATENGKEKVEGRGGNLVVAREVDKRPSQSVGGTTTARGNGNKASATAPSPSPVASVPATGALGEGSVAGSPAPVVDAISGVGGSPPSGGNDAFGPSGTGVGRPLPRTLTMLSNVTAAVAPGMIVLAGVGVISLGSQLGDDATEKAPKGPMPTGLPVGPNPVMPRDPSIPEARDPTPRGDADTPAAIDAATRAGEAQIEVGRRAAEQAGSSNMGITTLGPTVTPAQIPPLKLNVTYSAPGTPPIAVSPEPEVAQVLENGFGAKGRELANRELAGSQALLIQHEMAVEAQQAEAAQLIQSENDTATLQQIAAREETRALVEQDTARLRAENAEAIQEYQRRVATERSTAQAEVQRAKETAARAEAAQREAAEDDDDEAWYERAWGAVKSGVSWVGGVIKDAVVTAYRFIRDRIKRFFSKVRELVSAGISKIREIAGRIYRGIRDKIRAGLNKINEIARRIGSFVVDIVRRVGSFISDLIDGIVDAFRRIINAIADFWRWVWDLAVKVKEFIAMIANGAIEVFIELIEDVEAVIEKAKGAIKGLVNNTPRKIEEVYQEHLAPIIDRREPQVEPAGTPVQGMVIQRQAEIEPETEEEESHSAGIWRHLKVRGAYFLDHWWDIVKDAALEILIPGVALYRHVPKLWKAMKDAWNALWAGEFSDAIDAGLEAGREVMAIFSSFIAQVSIAAFIIGSVLGTPIVGVAALQVIGWVTIGADAALQIATIAKSASNLDDPGENEKRLETDYGRIADSSISLAVMLVLVALGAIASKAASSLVRRFPGLNRAAEALKHKIRRGLRRTAKRPAQMTSKLKKIDPIPPEALDLPVRKDLLPREQLAFDKWVAERRAAGHDVNKALAGKSAADVRRMITKQLGWLADQEARKAHNLKWEGEMLDPRMANGPIQQQGKDVWSRWNETEAVPEIDQGIRLNAKTGERVDIFGDDFPGIDGTIGKPPRPLQLKRVPAANDIADIPRVAEDALTKATRDGFTRVEVSIEAPGRTVAQVRKAFARNPSKFTDSKGVSRVRVWCDDGMFEPTSFKPVIPPPHPDLDKDEVPEAAGAAH